MVVVVFIHLFVSFIYHHRTKHTTPLPFTTFFWYQIPGMICLYFHLALELLRCLASGAIKLWCESAGDIVTSPSQQQEGTQRGVEIGMDRLFFPNFRYFFQQDNDSSLDYIQPAWLSSTWVVSCATYHITWLHVPFHYVSLLTDWSVLL